MLNPDELDRMAMEDAPSAGRLMTSVHCAECGYNLRSLPSIYTCPECGNPYNASPLRSKGIYQHTAEEFPAAHYASTIFCALVATILLWAGISQQVPLTILLGAVFVLLFVVFMYKAIVGTGNYYRAREISARIEKDRSTFRS